MDIVLITLCQGIPSARQPHRHTLPTVPSPTLPTVGPLDHAVHWRRPTAIHQASPKLTDTGAAGWKHAVLQAVQIPAVNRWHEAAGCQAQDDAGRKVMFADAVAELEVLVEHGAEGERDGLCTLVVEEAWRGDVCRRLP